MSYQVLARKWRPKNFAEVLGQGHVLKALVNALDSDRLHHAYLFAGTRGVGKTTLARVFAKALNCEQGVSSEPCGQCAACTEIDEGRFVDLIEVDAASRTKVDETRELLDNVPYAPTRARYKVYLIDEVHMFSNHSFNALLKTLEEPPPHVKFLLATTDPKKLPVTILSRCLQFNLTRLGTRQLTEHLGKVLGLEDIEFDREALELLASAASGSVRDALSLLDQAIAHGGGVLKAADVALMLGTVDQDQVFAIIDALNNDDGEALIRVARGLAQFVPDYGQVLADLLSVLRRIAVVHAVGAEADEIESDQRVIDLAGRVAADECQLFYQIALNGRRDLAVAPDPESGFEMNLLRMLAFRPDAVPDSGNRERLAPKPKADAVPTGATEAAAPMATAAAPTPPTAAPSAEKAAAAKEPATDETDSKPGDRAPETERVADTPARSVAAPPEKSASAPNLDSPTGEFDWLAVVDALELVGLPRELARNAALLERDGSRLVLAVAPQFEKLAQRRHVETMQNELARYLGTTVNVDIRIERNDGAMTPTEADAAAAAERQRQAEVEIENDPNVKALQENFGAVVEDVSARPGS